jgi:hypothetical protein
VVCGLASMLSEEGIYRVKEERREHGLGLGEIERAGERVPGGGWVAEGVAGDGLQQENLYQPCMGRQHEDGAV